MKFKGILVKTLPFVLAIMGVKALMLLTPDINHYFGVEDKLHLTELVEISDVGIIFTGAFFVIGLMLAATMADFKESEKIPGEIACNLEAIEDSLILALSVHKPAEGKEPLNQERLHKSLLQLSTGILDWFKSSQKDSKMLFSTLRLMNDEVYYLAKNGADKDSVKAIQDNVNQLRKQLTRSYTIARTNFIAPAYILLRSIVVSVIVLLFVCKFKTLVASFLVIGFVSFIFLYLFFLIKGLDDPFDFGSEGTEVDLLPLNRFIDRVKQGLHV
jgi:hypothetical protein